jgi:type I restriction enzyme, S subunit
MAGYKIQSKTLDRNRVFLLQRSELEGRLDPHFYLQGYKDLYNKIKSKNHKRLGDIVKFSNETWNQKDFFDNTFPYIEISEIDTVSGEIQKISIVEKEQAASRAKMIVRENDIIVSTTRPNRGAISLIKKEHDFSIASTGFSVIREITYNELNREFLFTVLKQQFSLKQFEQRSSGGNYPAITQEELSNVIIPIPDVNKQKQVLEIFNKCFQQKKTNEAEAERLLSSIDDYLLKELGIKLPELPKNTLENRMFVATLQQITGGRFDPKLYSTQSKELIKSLYKTNFNYKSLKSVIIQSCSGDWGNDDNEVFNDNEFVRCLVIRATEFDNKFNLNVDGSRAKYRLINKAKYKALDIQANDLLIEKSGGSENQPVGRISILTKELTDRYSLGFSNFVHKFRVNDEVVNPVFVFNYLKTIHNIKITDVMQSQTNGIRNLILNEYLNLPIPLPPLSKQQEIANHISSIRKKAQKLKDQTKDALQKSNEEIEKILLE